MSFLCIIIIAIIFKYIFEGYNMYKDAIETLSIEEKIQSIKEKENYTKIEEIPQIYINAVISVEDHRFYSHSGIDVIAICRAVVNDIKALDFAEGGSTITQQLVKNLMSDDAGSGKEGIERKIREMSRAYQLEKILKKEEILEKYLNVIFVGGNELHGVEYGAQYYFAKSAKDLDLAESCFLAGINHSPNAYNPYNKENDHAEKIKTRTKFVLDLMKEQNKISDNPEEAEKIYNEAEMKPAEENAESQGSPSEPADDINQFATYPVITSASVDTHGQDLGMPETMEAFNYEEYMHFNSQYLIQWELIKYGIENGFKKHNFYGIPANINEHPKDYGIYEFKRGFNGYVEELIGEFELPITWHYNLFKLIHKIKGVK